MPKKKTPKKKVKKEKSPLAIVPPQQDGPEPALPPIKNINREEVSAKIFIALIHAHATPPPRQTMSLDDADTLSRFSISAADILISNLRKSEPTD